jgi:uncharacterized CHY-type Zn-finger protein
MIEREQAVDTVINERIRQHDRCFKYHGIHDVTDIKNEHLPRMPAKLNENSKRLACQHCGTSFRTSEIRSEGHCPFCWRLY